MEEEISAFQGAVLSLQLSSDDDATLGGTELITKSVVKKCCEKGEDSIDANRRFRVEMPQTRLARFSQRAYEFVRPVFLLPSPGSGGCGLRWLSAVAAVSPVGLLVVVLVLLLSPFDLQLFERQTEPRRVFARATPPKAFELLIGPRNPSEVQSVYSFRTTHPVLTVHLTHSHTLEFVYYPKCNKGQTLYTSSYTINTVS